MKAFAYATDKDDEKQQQFQNMHRQIGFEVKLKPYMLRRNGTAKGDWDVGIALDIMEHARESNVVVLASGDGDFELLVRKVRSDFDTHVEVYGVAPLTAACLKEAASKFLPRKSEKGCIGHEVGVGIRPRPRADNRAAGGRSVAAPRCRYPRPRRTRH